MVIEHWREQIRLDFELLASSQGLLAARLERALEQEQFPQPLAAEIIPALRWLEERLHLLHQHLDGLIVALSD